MLGNILLISTIASSFLRLLLRKNFLFYISSICLISASIFLEIAFIRSDFTVQNVLFFSSTAKPLIYKISGLWTNSDASLLFWASLLSLICFISRINESDKKAGDFISYIFSSFILFLSAYIYFFSNPFVEVKNPPSEGLGLNPVLQDVAVSIHPPILYLGYVSYIVPFSYSIYLLFNNNVKEYFLKKMFIYARLGLLFLSYGIALGSWWAYRELGWGGFWFFDPVENISLMPWLVGISIYHYLILSIKNTSFVRVSILLSLINFLLILFGMLLVRSGSLVSVHSFSSNIEAGKIIVSLFAILVLVITYLYYNKASRLSVKSNSFKIRNPREKIIIYGSIFIYLATISIFIAIIYPLLYSLINGISITLDNRYFHIVFIPLSLVICLFSFISFFVGSNAFSIKTIYKNRNHAMILSHLGIIILAIGIFLNASLSKDLEFVGNVGKETKYASNISVKLENLYYSNGPNYYRQIADFWVTYNNQTVNLKPENRLYRVENMLSSESDIYSYITKDYYAIIGNIDDKGTIFANIYIRPWISIVWLGMFLTGLGVLISITNRFPMKNAN